jgi:hypothetical protein
MKLQYSGDNFISSFEITQTVWGFTKSSGYSTTSQSLGTMDGATGTFTEQPNGTWTASLTYTYNLGGEYSATPLPPYDSSDELYGTLDLSETVTVTEIGGQSI